MLKLKMPQRKDLASFSSCRQMSLNLCFRAVFASYLNSMFYFTGNVHACTSIPFVRVEIDSEKNNQQSVTL